MSDDVSRRSVLGLTASAAAVGLAGCSGGDSEDTPTDGTTTSPQSPVGTANDVPQTTGGESGTYMNGVGEDAAISLAVPGDAAAINSPYLQWDASADGVTIEESGAVTEGAGHYHLMIDTDPVTPGETIPSDDQHVHYGTGQTDGVLELEPGEHTLHLQVADGAHTAMGLTDTVDVTVSDAASLDLSTTVDGSVVEWAVTATDYTIEPSSNGINSNAGHLHAIIDADHVPVGDVIPGDANHVHFGDGATSGSIDLAEQLGDAYEPGEHTIHFQVGTGSHRATMIHAHATVTTE
jgi:hypothetical protein